MEKYLKFFFQLLLVQKFHKNHNLYESFQSQTLRYLTNDILLGREIQNYNCLLLVLVLFSSG